MILLAKRLDETGIPALQAMDIAVRRNAFGRQVDSFEADLSIPALGDVPFHAVFIRAPIIEAGRPRVSRSWRGFPTGPRWPLSRSAFSPPRSIPNSPGTLASINSFWISPRPLSR